MPHVTSQVYLTLHLTSLLHCVVLQVIKKDEGIYASNMSANRDASVFKDPDTFDIHRTPGPQLGFGYGAHVCVAMWLARAELQCVFGKHFVIGLAVEHMCVSRLSA